MNRSISGHQRSAENVSNFLMVRKYIKFHGIPDLLIFFREADFPEIPDVKCYIIGVYRITVHPAKRFCQGIAVNGNQYAIAYADQVGRDRHVEVNTVGFITKEIFGWPPQA